MVGNKMNFILDIKDSNKINDKIDWDWDNANTY